MKKLLLGAAALLATAFAAQAGVSVQFGIGAYPQPPVIVSQPAPVYVQPAPVVSPYYAYPQVVVPSAPVVVVRPGYEYGRGPWAYPYWRGYYGPRGWGYRGGERFHGYR
jgi:hypothetical protein